MVFANKGIRPFGCRFRLFAGREDFIPYPVECFSFLVPGRSILCLKDHHRAVSVRLRFTAHRILQGVPQTIPVTDLRALPDSIFPLFLFVAERSIVGRIE